VAGSWGLSGARARSASEAKDAHGEKERVVEARCVCLLLQDLVQSCVRGEGGDIGGHVLRETTSRGLCGLVCPSRGAVAEGRQCFELWF
jgi:hypothetical protein